MKNEQETAEKEQVEGKHPSGGFHISPFKGGGNLKINDEPASETLGVENQNAPKLNKKSFKNTNSEVSEGAGSGKIDSKETDSVTSKMNAKPKPNLDIKVEPKAEKVEPKAEEPAADEKAKEDSAKPADPNVVPTTDVPTPAENAPVEVVNQQEEAAPVNVSNTENAPVTPQDSAAIERLKALGFPEQLVMQAYFACEKNEDSAANFLKSHNSK